MVHDSLERIIIVQSSYNHRIIIVLVRISMRQLSPRVGVIVSHYTRLNHPLTRPLVHTCQVLISRICTPTGQRLSIRETKRPLQNARAL